MIPSLWGPYAYWLFLQAFSYINLWAQPVLSWEESDWIVRSQFFSLTVHRISTFDSCFLLWSSNWGESWKLSNRLKTVHFLSPSGRLHTCLAMDKEVIGCVYVFIFVRNGLCVHMCVYIWTYVCCEDSMAYFTRANLSNERSEKWIGNVLVGGSGRERRSTGSKL